MEFFGFTIVVNVLDIIGAFIGLTILSIVAVLYLIARLLKKKGKK